MPDNDTYGDRRRSMPDRDVVKWAKLEDGTVWPLIQYVEDGGLEWQLRYGDPERVRFAAASVVAAYQRLTHGGITTTQVRRLRWLRRNVRD